MDVSQYTKMFENLVPTQQLEGISGNADSVIATAKRFIGGTGFKAPFC